MFFETLPGCSTVPRAVKSTSRSAAGHTPGSAASLPQRCEKNVGVVRVEGDIDASGVLIFVQHLFPGLAAIGGTENTAFGVWPIRVSERCHENNIRIVGIDNDFADSAAIVQADIFPALAPVKRFVNSITLSNVSANARLARANVNGVVIGIGHSKTANRSASLFVKHWRPGHGAVG